MDYINYFISQWNIGVAQNRAFIKIRFTRILFQIVEKFYLLGFISAYELQPNNTIVLFGLKPNIQLKQKSKPGKRLYFPYAYLSQLHKIIFVQTSKGLVTSYDLDLYKLGGEFIFEIDIF